MSCVFSFLSLPITFTIDFLLGQRHKQWVGVVSLTWDHCGNDILCHTFLSLALIFRTPDCIFVLAISPPKLKFVAFNYLTSFPNAFSSPVSSLQMSSTRFAGSSFASERYCSFASVRLDILRLNAVTGFVFSSLCSHLLWRTKSHLHRCLVVTVA